MKKTILALCVLWGAAASAQTEPETVVGSVQINVVDKYKANIKSATKLSGQPDFADTTTSKLPVKYSIRPQMLSYDFTPQLITPVRVSGVRLGKLPQNMVRLGAGNYGTAMAEIILSSSRSRGFNWDIGLRHFSSQKGVKDIAYDKNPFMENQFYLGGRWIFRDYRVKARAGMDWNSNSYYGIPQSVEALGIAIPDLEKNGYQRYFGSVVIDKIKKREKSIFQKAGINYHYFKNNWQTDEQLLQLETNWLLPKQIENHIIGAELNVDWQKTTMGVTAQDWNRFNVQFYPKVVGKIDRVNYTLGLNFNFLNSTKTANGASESGLSTYIFPHLIVEAELVRDILFVFGGWTGDMQLNGMYELTKQNPFLLPEVGLLPSAKNRIYMGVEGAIAKNISYKLEGGINYVRSMPIFTRSGDVADTLFDSKRIAAFGVQYARGNYVQFRGELGYNVKNTRVSGFVEYYSYSLYLNDKGDMKNPFHLPKLKIGGNVQQIIKDKITATAGIAYVAGRDGLAQDGQIFEAEMNDIVDVNLGVGYNVNNNLSANLEFANLLSQDYSIWLGYPSQRFRVMLSLMYKF